MICASVEVEHRFAAAANEFMCRCTFDPGHMRDAASAREQIIVIRSGDRCADGVNGIEDRAILQFQLADAVAKPAAELSALWSAERLRDLLRDGQKVVDILRRQLLAKRTAVILGQEASADAIFDTVRDQPVPSRTRLAARRLDRHARSDDEQDLSCREILAQVVQQLVLSHGPNYEARP
jgi:hypothetical protein